MERLVDERKINGTIDRQKYKQMVRQIDGKIVRQKDRQMERQIQYGKIDTI